jgi:mRNA-degrading endonuclease RelE of RelBE toxin-antitoxin system
VTYRLVMARSAARALAEGLPAAVAAAEFVTLTLLHDPTRVGKPLQPPLDGKWSARRGQYRIISTVDSPSRVVTVLHVSHRRNAYR